MKLYNPQKVESEPHVCEICFKNFEDGYYKIETDEKGQELATLFVCRNCYED